jgi:hypothetical protein
MVTIQIVCEKPFVESNQRWVRIPSKGYCPWSGLSRSHIFNLISEGKVRSSNLKKPGNMRGVRLVWLPSLYEYIEREGQISGPDDSAPEESKEAYTLSLDGLSGLDGLQK